MPNCRCVLLDYIYSFRKNHRPRSSLLQINDATNGNLLNKLDINYSKFNFHLFIKRLLFLYRRI